jgi:hypothetical protein
MRCPEKTGDIVNAKFIDNNTVIVWTKGGVGYVYQVSSLIQQAPEKQHPKKHSSLSR